MLWRLSADAVVVAHLAFILFVIVGGFIAWRWRAVLFAHIPALAWALWIEISGAICPLTPLENTLRRRAGEAGYAGGFIQHYLIPVIYPPGLTRRIQWLLAAALFLITAIAYEGVRRRMRRAH